MNSIQEYIISWLKAYAEKSSLEGFVVGVSGGVDSALTASLCAETGLKVILLNMPIKQSSAEYLRANEQILNLVEKHSYVSSLEISLTSTFEEFTRNLPESIQSEQLVLANSRSRLRMITLYAIAQANRCLVVGTGNKIEDFGIGFFTKYGDGGVDVSPIADLTKTEVFKLAKNIGVVESILNAKPTDGLWEDGRSDEDQIGATYPELEWAMFFKDSEKELSSRQREVLSIYKRLNKLNAHKMHPIPVCTIPSFLKREM